MLYRTPEDGIEKIITLRARLLQRIRDNSELIGGDEHFFDDDKRTQEQYLRDLYAGAVQLEETDDETDLLSRAYDIWRQATQDNAKLAETIKQLPDVIYSAKDNDTEGVIAYIRQGGIDILAHLNNSGEIISQSQARILDILECEEDTIRQPITLHHHSCVKQAAVHLADSVHTLGGQLGNRRSTRSKLYHLLKRTSSTAIDNPDVPKAAQAVYDYPLTETARDHLTRLFRSNVADKIICLRAVELHQDNALTVMPNQRNSESQIICSMGLVHGTQ